MKVLIDKDEWYPVFSVETRCGEEVDVPAETVDRWKRVTAEFEAIQTEMKMALDGPTRRQR